MLAISILTALIVLSNILLGLLVFYKNPKSFTNILFFLLTIVLSLWTITNYFSIQRVSAVEIFFWLKAVMFVTSALFPIFYLLAKSFPFNSLKTNKLELIFVIGITLLSQFLVLTNSVFKGVIVSGESVSPIAGLGIIVVAINFLGFLSLSLVTLYRKERSLKGLEKVQLQYFILGIAITFICGTITNFVFVNLFKVTSFVAFGPLFSLSLVGFISYAIIKHQFLDIRLIVARSVSYTLLLAILGFFYALGTVVTTSIFLKTATTLQQVTIYATITLVVALTFQPLRRVLERTTDRIFYKDRYDSSELLADLTHIMASTLRLEELTHGILEELLGKIKISKAAFILVEKKQIYDVKSEGYDLSPELSEDDVFKILSQGKTLVFEELEEGEIKDILRRLGLEVSVPLVTESEEMGLFVCGAKASGEIYSDGDLKVLDILAPEAAVAIQNAKAYEEIKRFSVTLQEEVEKATHDLQIANKKLKELDKLKDDFVSVASHELRTPMTAIRSYLWMALAGRGGELTGKQKYYLDRAYTSTDRLIRLVNNMLNVSRIESGRIEIEFEKLDLNKLTRDVVDEVTPRANELGIKVACYEQKDLPNVLADSDKIKEVLINLVGNSLKFTPKGGSININFNVRNGMVETSVSDTGKGIAKEDIPKLFKKFGLIEGSYAITQQDGGTGLGLYISWNIILLHNGVITVESEGVDKGATFTFTLPVFKKEDLAKIKQKEEEKEAIGLVSVGI